MAFHISRDSECKEGMRLIMDIETRQSYSEVNKFLEVIGEEMSNKIPLKLRNFFKREMDKNYIPTININTPIKEQKLKRKTIAIIAGLNLQYWCKEERKKELLEIYYNNEKNIKMNYTKNIILTIFLKIV